ncbi:hypothetical protein M082_0392 [Bacteroides fragilis str. 3725 D9 ii]|nr:hypothetical protein M082_0392 [Bacteroides fragilis str. 3725 D9 ii]
MDFLQYAEKEYKYNNILHITFHNKLLSNQYSAIARNR